MTIWQILEIEKTTDLSVIKKAYATKIKKHKPEIDPEGFQLLRKAYEEALKFARTEPVENSDFEETEYENENPAEKNASSRLDPDYSVFQILHLLAHDQEEVAFDYFIDIDKQGFLDNLELSSKFQELIAPRMTDKVASCPAFTTMLIDYFKWKNHPEIQEETLFGIALRSLIHQTGWYRFSQELRAGNRIQNKTEAQKNGRDWVECSAIKILLSKKNPYLIILSLIFRRKKRKALFSLLKETNSWRTLLMEPEMEKSFLSWCINYGNTRYHLTRFSFAMLFIFAYMMMVYNKHRLAPTEPTKPKQQQTVQNAIPSAYTNIVIRLSEHQGKKLHGSHAYILHIPPVKICEPEDVVWYIMLMDENNNVLKSIHFNQDIVRNKDGSVDIFLQPQKPAGKESNWLETADVDFILTGSFFWKKNAEIIAHWKGPMLSSHSELVEHVH